MKNNIKKYTNKNIEIFRMETGELDYLKLATEISKLFNKSNKHKMFQKILDYVILFK